MKPLAQSATYIELRNRMNPVSRCRAAPLSGCSWSVVGSESTAGGVTAPRRSAMTKSSERAALYIRSHTIGSMLAQERALRDCAQRFGLTVAAMYHDSGPTRVHWNGFSLALAATSSIASSFATILGSPAPLMTPRGSSPSSRPTACRSSSSRVPDVTASAARIAEAFLLGPPGSALLPSLRVLVHADSLLLGMPEGRSPFATLPASTSNSCLEHPVPQRHFWVTGIVTPRACAGTPNRPARPSRRARGRPSPPSGRCARPPTARACSARGEGAEPARPG